MHTLLHYFNIDSSHANLNVAPRRNSIQQKNAAAVIAPEKNSSISIQKSLLIGYDKPVDSYSTLICDLDRLIAKGVIFFNRFIAINWEEADIEIERGANTRRSLVKKNPPTRLQSLHYRKVTPNPYNEFIGPVIAQFLYPDDKITPKNRLIVRKKDQDSLELSVTSKIIKGTTRLDKHIRMTDRKSYYTAEEFGVDLTSLCKVIAIADFIGLADNHEGNVRKTAAGMVVRIDFEYIPVGCLMDEILPSILSNSRIDRGIVYTKEYICEINKIAHLDQNKLNVVLSKLEEIMHLYQACVGEQTLNLKRNYGARIQHMQEYAQKLEKKRVKRQNIEESTPLKYISMRYEELGMGIPTSKLDDWWVNPRKDPYRAAVWILQQAEKYKTRDVSLNKITKTCLDLRDNAEIGKFEFQVLFILNARNNLHVKAFIEQYVSSLEEEPTLFYDILVGGRHVATKTSPMKCSCEEISLVLDTMHRQLQEMELNPLFLTGFSEKIEPVYTKEFTDFKHICTTNFIQHHQPAPEEEWPNCFSIT